MTHNIQLHTKDFGVIDIVAEDAAKARAIAGLIMPPSQQPREFNIEEAMAGAPVLWVGQPVRWLGFSDKNSGQPNIIEHDGGLSYVADSELRMAPKQKKTGYVNLYTDGSWLIFEKEHFAREDAKHRTARFEAVPLETEE